jgi:hypothetical protein
MSSSAHFRKWVDFETTSKEAVIISTTMPPSPPQRSEEPPFEEAILGFIDEARRAGVDTGEEPEPQPAGSTPIQIDEETTDGAGLPGARERARKRGARLFLFGTILVGSLGMTGADTRSLCTAIDDSGSALFSLVKSIGDP